MLLFRRLCRLFVYYSNFRILIPSRYRWVKLLMLYKKHYQQQSNNSCSNSMYNKMYHLRRPGHTNTHTTMTHLLLQTNIRMYLYFFLGNT